MNGVLVINNHDDEGLDGALLIDGKEACVIVPHLGFRHPQFRFGFVRCRSRIDQVNFVSGRVCVPPCVFGKLVGGFVGRSSGWRFVAVGCNHHSRPTATLHNAKIIFRSHRKSQHNCDLIAIDIFLIMLHVHQYNKVVAYLPMYYQFQRIIPDSIEIGKPQTSPFTKLGASPTANNTQLKQWISLRVHLPSIHNNNRMENI